MRFDDSAVLQYKISFIKSTYTSAEQVDMDFVKAMTMEVSEYIDNDFPIAKWQATKPCKY